MYVLIITYCSYVKANPGVLNSATQGIGTTSHLTSELFQQMAGVKFQHIHYRGSAPAVQDLVAGNVDVAFDNIGAAGALIRAGTIRALGLATEKPLASLPGVPTVKDTVPGFVVVTWFALVAPPKVPQAIVDKLHADINEALERSGGEEAAGEPVGRGGRPRRSRRPRHSSRPRSRPGTT